MALPITGTQSVHVELRDWSGAVLERVLEPMDFWKRLTPLVPDERLPNLGQVDPFDDTRFNYKACTELLGEIQLLRAHASIAEDVAFLERVEALVSRVASPQHLYIWFIGD